MEAVERGHDLAIVADVSFGVGIASLVAGTVLLLVSSPEESHSQAST